VLAKTFKMSNFKAMGLEHRDKRPHFVEFAIGEHVALNERTVDSRWPSKTCRD
jgi:hypothetical protein